MSFIGTEDDNPTLCLEVPVSPTYNITYSFPVLPVAVDPIRTMSAQLRDMRTEISDLRELSKIKDLQIHRLTEHIVFLRTDLDKTKTKLDDSCFAQCPKCQRIAVCDQFPYSFNAAEAKKTKQCLACKSSFYDDLTSFQTICR